MYCFENNAYTIVSDEGNGNIKYGGPANTAKVKEKEAFSSVNDAVRVVCCSRETLKGLFHSFFNSGIRRLKLVKIFNITQ